MTLVPSSLFHGTWNGIETPHDVFVESPIYPGRRLRQYEYVFLIDDLCGHDRKRADMLVVTSLHKGPMSASRAMRDVVITSDAGVLGNEFDHPKKLKVGMIQKLEFSDFNNYGMPETEPYW